MYKNFFVILCLIRCVKYSLEASQNLLKTSSDREEDLNSQVRLFWNHSSVLAPHILPSLLLNKTKRKGIISESGVVIDTCSVSCSTRLVVTTATIWWWGFVCLQMERQREELFKVQEVEGMSAVREVGVSLSCTDN